MSRDAARQGIARYLGGTTLDTGARIYRPTPLAAFGLAGVRPYWTPKFEDHDYLATLPEGSTMGAVSCVHLADDARVRIAAGIKRERYAVELYTFMYALSAQSEDVQAFGDALLGAITARLEADPTMGRVFVQAGEDGLVGTVPIDTRTDPPVEVGNGLVTSVAVTMFNAEMYLSVTFA